MTAVLYPEWPRSIVYSLSPSPTVSGVVIRLILTWATGMRSGFRDIRFRDQDLEPCAHWIQTFKSQTTATVWVRLNAGQTTLECLFGNSTAVTGSDPDATFVLFDTFAELDGDVWVDHGGTAVEGFNLKIDGNALGDRGIHSQTTYGIGYAVVARAAVAFASEQSHIIGFSSYNMANAAVYRETASEMQAFCNDSTSIDTAPFTYAPTFAYRVFQVCRRSSTSVEVIINSTTSAACDEDIPQGDLPVVVYQWYDSGVIALDWIAVRRCEAVDPVPTYVSTGPNPNSVAFESQKIISWNVRRSITDAMYQASVVIDGLVPVGTDFRQVSIIEPDHNGIDRLIFYGFLPAQTSQIDDAANQTTYQGWDYSFYINSRTRPGYMSVIPTTYDPGTMLKAYFDDATQWPAGIATFDTAKIHAVTDWGSAALPVREFTSTNTTKVGTMVQQIADEIGWIWMPRWRDVGSTPSYTHQDPAYRIIRVEAEDYDQGGAGVDYYDTTTGNAGGAYRDDDVDIEANPAGGYNIGWIRDGEWLDYTVTFPVDGQWTLKLYTAAPLTGRWVKVYLDGILIDTITIDATGDYETFAWNTDTGSILIGTVGSAVVRLEFGGSGSGDNEHMNIGAFDLYPPPASSPTAPVITPALYFCDEADIDDGDVGLDLPPTAVVWEDDATLAGPVTYAESFGTVANAVVLYYRTPSAPDTIVGVTKWDLTTSLEGWVDRVVEVKAPITTETAEALAQALLDFYTLDWGTVTATFIGRTDLQLCQRLQFVGHTGIPADTFRITEISYSGGLAKSEVQVTAIPAHKFAIERQLQRALRPDPTTEIETVVSAILAQRATNLTGVVATIPATGTVTVTLDRGGTLTARSGAGVGDRVVCIPAEGVGYVATVIAPAP